MAGKAALVIPALKKHTASVIVAHGLGDSGAGWVFLAENWRRRGKFEDVSFIFPNAPNIPISINLGMRMPGWYDITSFDSLDSSFDEEGINRSRSYLNNLIRSEIEKGIPSDRIILGGFSQGGAMSLITGATCPDRLGGIFALSSYMLMPRKFLSFVPKDKPNQDTPIFMGHGDSDPLVKYEWGVETARLLREWGWKVDLKTYRGLEHSADPKEIDDLEDFVRERLAASSATTSPAPESSTSTSATEAGSKPGL